MIQHSPRVLGKKIGADATGAAVPIPIFAICWEKRHPFTLVNAGHISAMLYEFDLRGF